MANENTEIMLDGIGMVYKDQGGNDVTALTNVTLDIKKGEFISLLGPSGCGKTTLLRIIADLLHPTTGKITVGGVTPREARLAQRYGIVFQSSSAADEGGDSSGAMMSSEEIVKSAAAAGMVGNWGLGNEYEIQALLTKYGLPTDYITQDFTMDQFDSDSVTLASAMTYNELGLVKNSYDGGYGYGDSVSVIDMNDEGVAMLEDNLFTSKAFAEANPNTVKAFVSASMKGWAYACEHPDEAAEIVFEAGSSVSADHQAYMASEVAKLVTTDMNGNAVSASDVGNMDETAMQQTLDLAKQYIILEDSAAKDKLASLTLDDIRSTDFLTYDPATDGAPEKTSVSVQLKWLPQAQFMGYYVAQTKGYYDEVGLTVDIISGGGDISETTAVYNGTVDFGVTWVSNLINANAGGMELLEVAQVYQRSGLVLVYKNDNYTK